MLRSAVPVMLTALLLLSGCGSDESPGVLPEATPELGLSFDGAELISGVGPGSLKVGVTPLLSGGGTIVPVESSDGSTAARFPAFKAAAPPLGVLLIKAVGEDFLSPGTSDFAYGADFSIDATSEGGVDNGNNVMQRGLFGKGSQYKLQVDHGSASCRVTGTGEEVLATAPMKVKPDTWYRARCRLRGDRVTVRLAELQDGTPGTWSEARASGTVGSVSFAPEIPMTVGAKLSPEGKLVPNSPDQFNGALDNLYYLRLL